MPDLNDLVFSIELYRDKDCHLDQVADQIRYRVNFHSSPFDNVDVLSVEQLLTRKCKFAGEPL